MNKLLTENTDSKDDIQLDDLVQPASQQMNRIFYAITDGSSNRNGF
jgi:hypothetical protein